VVKKWFFVGVSFMKPALLTGSINRAPAISGFFTTFLGVQGTLIGIKGYVDTIFADDFFHIALTNQIKFAILYFIICFSLSLGIAILVLYLWG